MRSLLRFRKSLAFRLVFPFAVSLIAVLAALAVFLGHTVRNEGLRELTERGSLLAETLAHNAELPLLARDARSLAALLEGAGGEDLLAARILDGRSRVLARYSAPARGPVEGADGREDPPLVLESPVLTQASSGEGQEESVFALDAAAEGPKKLIGKVQLVISRERMAARTRRLQAEIGAAGAGLLLVCVGIGFGLVRIAGAPLGGLVKATRKVAAGDLSVRVVPSSTDEIGELGRAFNRMAAELELARNEVVAERAEREQAQETLIQAEKMTALGELVAGVAHEINNPLASVMGYTQLLMARDLSPDVTRRLEIVFSETERASRIVRNLLTFARKQPPEKKHLGLNGIIEKVLELKAYHFRANQIQVEKDLAPDLPKTMLDYYQMQQVLLNLFNNSEHALRAAGRGGTIRLATRRAGDRIEARVSDDGPGIPPEIQARIFEPFFTTKEVGQGTGLGLSLCYGIIQEHGGTIRVESPQGKGTTFVIDFPILRDPGIVAEAAPAAISHPVPSLRILVVDDEPGVLGFLVEALSAKGHRVDTASDVPEALRKIAADGHDLIISDMKMPHGSGKDVYAAVAEKSQRLARRIVFTTGDAMSAETQWVVREKGNVVLMKPYKIEEIEGAVADAMRN